MYSRALDFPEASSHFGRGSCKDSEQESATSTITEQLPIVAWHVSWAISTMPAATFVTWEPEFHL